MGISWLLFLLFSFMTSLVSTAPAGRGNVPDSPFAHVRPLDRTCRALIRRGADSHTFRALLARIDRSDIIAFVECEQRLRTGIVGETRLVAHAGGFRYVRVAIAVHVAGDEAAAVVGHEMYHVTELAAAPQAIDASGVRELYLTLGHRTCAAEPPCFETAMARRAADDVRRELREAATR